MAGLTGIRGVDVSRAFARCRDAIVTTGTASGHTGMVKRCAYPGSRDVTDFTRCGGRNVCRALAGGNDAIVAGFTSTVDLFMVHRDHWGPARRNMAGITLIGRIYMCCGFANGDYAVMATLTSTTRLIVIHRDNR